MRSRGNPRSKAFELEQCDYGAGCPTLCGDERRTRFEALNEAKAATVRA